MWATEWFMKAQIEHLEKENKSLKEELEKWKMIADENGTHYDMLEKENRKLEADNELLRLALKQAQEWSILV